MRVWFTFLDEALIQSSLYPASFLMLVCCLFLYLLADITSEDTSSFQPQAMDQSVCLSSWLMWPKECPSHTDWLQWSHTILEFWVLTNQTYSPCMCVHSAPSSARQFLSVQCNNRPGLHAEPCQSMVVPAIFNGLGIPPTNHVCVWFCLPCSPVDASIIALTEFDTKGVIQFHRAAATHHP